MHPLRREISRCAHTPSTPPPHHHHQHHPSRKELWLHFRGTWHGPLMLIMCVRCSRSISCLKHNHCFLLFLPPFSLGPTRIHPHRCHPTLPLISSDSPSLPISCFYKHKEHIVSSGVKVNLFSLAVAPPGLGPSELLSPCFAAGIKVAPRLHPIVLLKLQCAVHLVHGTNMCKHWRFHFLLLFP